MTRSHCLRRLLEHGALTWCDLLAITGWKYNELRGVMYRMLDAGIVRKEPAGPRRNLYRLAA